MIVLKFVYIYNMLRRKQEIFSPCRICDGHWSGFSPNTFISPANFYSTNCLVFINHPVIGAVRSRRVLGC
jgi:hypothetical protein